MEDCISLLKTWVRYLNYTGRTAINIPCARGCPFLKENISKGARRGGRDHSIDIPLYCNITELEPYFSFQFPDIVHSFKTFLFPYIRCLPTCTSTLFLIFTPNANFAAKRERVFGDDNLMTSLLFLLILYHEWVLLYKGLVSRGVEAPPYALMIKTHNMFLAAMSSSRSDDVT